MGALTAVWRTPERRFWLLACLLALYLGLTKTDGGMIDLRVYRRGAEFVAAGDPLYDLRPGKLPFTYPPFAAVFMMPIAAVPWVWAVKIWTGISVLGVAAVLRQSAARAVSSRSIRMPLALLGCLTLEPVRSTLHFGQINLILAAVIMLDLVGRDHPARGFLVGVAAGLKLTPLVFVGFLLVTRQWAALRNACVGLATTVAVGFLVTPRESWRYWTDILHSAARVGGTGYTSNQSVMGFLFRIELHGDAPWVLPTWAVVSGSIAALCLLLARHRWTLGDRVGAVAVCSVATLLASPVAWTHHWVWVIPIGVTLINTARRRARRPTRPILAVIVGLVWFWWFWARPIWWVPVQGDSANYWTFGQALLGNSYIIFALLALAYVSYATWLAPERAVPAVEAVEAGPIRTPSRDDLSE